MDGLVQVEWANADVKVTPSSASWSIAGEVGRP